MIQTKGLKKEYKNKHRRVSALKETTLGFDSKGLVFVLGESGAGKSTLLNLLSIQEKPTSGDLIIDGRDTKSLSGSELSSLRNEDFAVLFQDLNLLEEFSVYDNLRLARQIQGKNLTRDEAIKALGEFSLPENIIDEMPFSLSGGQRQRVALARALVKDFKVLFCDEPTASLDDENASIVASCLKAISKDRLVIAATHDTRIAKEYGDRVIVMKDGNVASDTGKDASSAVENKNADSKKSSHRRLPAKTLFKLSMHGVKESVPRFVFALISTLLTLSVFMISMSFYFYDEVKTSYECFKKEDISYVQLSETRVIDEHNRAIVPLFLKDKTRLDSTFGLVLGASVNYYSGVFDAAFSGKPDEKQNERAYYFDSSTTKDYGYDLIGEMPRYNDSNIIEVGLTKYDCYALGYASTVSEDESVYKNIIGTKTIKVKLPKENSEGYEMKMANVSCVIDTHFKEINYGEKEEWAKAMQNLEFAYETHIGVFFDEVRFRSIVESKDGCVDVYVPNSAKPLEKAIEFNRQNNTNEEGDVLIWSCDSRLNESLNAVRNTQRTYSELSLVVSLFLLSIAALAFVSFIASSVSVLRPSVAVLESLGISKLAATCIYGAEALFLGLVCGMASIPAYYGVVEWVGSFLSKELLLPVSPFSFNIWIALFSVFAVCLLAVVVSSIVSVVSKRKRK